MARFPGEGIWVVEELRLNGSDQAISVSENVVRIPWISLHDGAVTGNAGCNDLGGSYSITSEGAFDFHDAYMNAMFCGPEDGSLIQGDLTFEAVMWSESMEMTFQDDEMVWTNGNNQIVFRSVAMPPTSEP